MGKVNKDVHYASLFGAYVPLTQHEDKDGTLKLTGENNPLPIAQRGSNVQVYDGSVAWANSEAVNTNKTIVIPLPATLQGDSLYEIIVTNPSTESDISVKVQNKVTLGGSAKFPELTSLLIEKSKPDGEAHIVQGFLLGEEGRLVLSNATALGVAGAFTAYVHVRKV